MTHKHNQTILAEQQIKRTEKYRGMMKQQSIDPAEVVGTQINQVVSGESRAPCIGEGPIPQLSINLCAWLELNPALSNPLAARKILKPTWEIGKNLCQSNGGRRLREHTSGDSENEKAPCAMWGMLDEEKGALRLDVLALGLSAKNLQR